jgi:LytR cell envelope-related transcriptional attenuator
MEHSLRLEEPWRTRAMVAAAVAVIELVVILGVAIILIGGPVSDRVSSAAEAKVLAPPKPAAKPKKRPKPAPALPKLERGQTSVIVLNGNGRNGAAHEQADLVRARGYLIGSVGNAPRTDFARSLVMYRPGYKPEALRLARDTGVRMVTPLDGLNQKDLLGAHLALVVGG